METEYTVDSASVDWTATPTSKQERDFAYSVGLNAEFQECESLRYRSDVRDGPEAVEYEKIIAGIACSLIHPPSEDGHFYVEYSECPVSFDPEEAPVLGSNDPRYVINLLAQPEVGFVEILGTTDEGNDFEVANAIRATPKLLALLHEFDETSEANGEPSVPDIEAKEPQVENTHVENAMASATPAVVDTPPTEQASVATTDESYHTNPLDHSRILDVHRWSDSPEVNTFVDFVFSQLKSTSGNENKRKKHLKVILLDLYLAWSDDPELKIAYHRGANAYKNGRYNKLHISKLTPEVVDWLIDAGYVEHAKGWNDRRPGGQRRLSRMWPSRKLIDLFETAKFGPLDIGYIEGQESIVLRKFDPSLGKQVDDHKYEDTPDTERMRNSLKSYNNLLWHTFIDIPGLETPWIDLGPDIRGRHQRLPISQHDKFTRRIFNRGSWDKGGRFYGGWWQRCPSEWRKRIFINDKPTNEIDYSGLHMVMLYALAGIDYWKEVGADPYSLELPILKDLGVSSRSVCKQLVLVALNAKNDEESFGAFRDNAEVGSPEKRMSNGALSQILETLRKRHKPIADCFASDAGIDLMNLDSQITERLIDQFTAEGIPILLIHDSYIVPVRVEQLLIARMHDAFATVMKGVHARAIPSKLVAGSIHPKTMTWEEWRPMLAELKDRFPGPRRSKRYLTNLRRFNEWRGRSEHAGN